MGEGCRLLAFCLLANLVRAEAPVPSVATSECPKRSEGGCPCRNEEGAEPRANPAGVVRGLGVRPVPSELGRGGLSPGWSVAWWLDVLRRRGGNMRRGSHVTWWLGAYRVSEYNPGESLA